MKKIISLFALLSFTATTSSGSESPKNIGKNWSFEKDILYWTVPGWIKNTIIPKIDSKNAKAGKHSVRFDAEFGKNAYLMQAKKRDPRVKEYRISGWVKLKGVKNWAPLITGVVMQKEKGKLKFKSFNAVPAINGSDSDWIYAEKTFTVPEGTLQVRICPKTYSTDPSKKPEGTIWFDCLQLEELITRGDKISLKQIFPGGDQGLFLPKTKPFIDVQIANTFTENKQVAFKTVLRDYYNKKLYEKNEIIDLNKLDVVKHHIDLPPQQAQGFYSVNVIVTLDDIPVASKTASFVVVRPIEKPDPFFGLTQYYLSIHNLKTARLMGAGSAGLIVPWKNEWKKGEYNWTRTDQRVNEYLKNGLEIVGAFTIMGNHYSQPSWVLENIKKLKSAGENPYTEQYYKDAASFEYKAVKRYKEHIKEWSAVDEIDLAMHKDAYEKAHYIKRVKNLYKAIKKVDPAITLGGVGVSGCDGQKSPRFPVARMLWENLHDSLDFMAYDTYVDPKTFGPGYKPVGPERGNLRKMLLESLDIVKKYGKNRIAIDEKGYKIVSTLPVDSIYAKQMAEVLARAYVIARSIPENRHWLYFLFKGAKEGLNDYGLWRLNCPRPTVAAYATVARRLAHVTDPVMIDIHKDIYSFVFKKGSGSVTALWTIADEPVSLAFNMPCSYKLYDIMNNPSEGKNGKQNLTLSKSPIFIECAAKPQAIIKELKKATCVLPELKGEIYLKSLSMMVLHLVNQSNRAIKTALKVKKTDNIEIKSPNRIVNLESGKSINIQFEIGNGTFKSLNGSKWTMEAEVGDRKYNFKKKFDLFAIEKFKSPIKINGDLSEFKNVNPITLDNASHLFPTDAIPNKLWTGPDDLSCKVYLAYDDNNFYFATEVTDDVMINERSRDGIWGNDSFQIAFDTENNALAPKISGSGGYDANDCEFGLALTPNGPQIFCYKASYENQKTQGQVLPFKVIVSKKGHHKMIYEAAIPWQALSPLKPKSGNAFGFNFINLDSDVSGRSAMYWMGLTPGIAGGKKPEDFKTFILLP